MRSRLGGVPRPKARSAQPVSVPYTVYRIQEELQTPDDLGFKQQEGKKRAACRLLRSLFILFCCAALFLLSLCIAHLFGLLAIGN